jgi:hypothetical protein
VLPDTRLSRRLDVNEVHFMHSCTTVFGEHTVDAALRNTVPNRWKNSTEECSLARLGAPASTNGVPRM